MEIWHNPRCSKSRQTVAILDEAGADYEVRRYLDEPPTAERLAEVLDLLGMEPWELVRTGEAEYRELGMSEWPPDRARWIAAMVDHPRLIERPVVIDSGQAVLGRPPENVRALLG